jgi:hypothetical protein
MDIIITFQTTPWSCDSGAEHSERSELCEGDSTWDGCQIGNRRWTLKANTTYGYEPSFGLPRVI